MTTVIESINQWQHVRATFPHHKSVGFVPTMGNLHRGHAALMQRSVSENDITVVSIYVNPTQFNNASDLDHYPRTMDADLRLLEELGVDWCLHPSAEAMYPESYECKVSESSLSTSMEGSHRPGHFDGMLTVVLKLLSLVKANKAYFGEKDYQQYLLVKKMANAFFLDTEIIPCHTEREASGLALSSRNNRLTSAQKELAEKFATIFHQPTSIENIRQQLSALNISIDYIEEHQGRRFAAVHVGDVRLIDNYAVQKSHFEGSRV